MRCTELKRLRDRDMYRAYRKALEHVSFSNLREAADYARLSPAPQYYIEARTASLLVGKIRRGVPVKGINDCRMRMLERLLHEYEAFLQNNPRSGLSREKIFEILVSSSAPEFYIGSERARHILGQESRRQKERFLNSL